MNAERRFEIFQVEPGKPMPVEIDTDGPKGIKRIQAILKEIDKDSK